MLYLLQCLRAKLKGGINLSLKKYFNAMKNEGYVVKPLEMYLLGLSATDSDRALNVNAPSSVGQCLRSRYYARVEAERDPYSVDARTRRIFDNGTAVHERLQSYLKEAGILLMDEVPIINHQYNIQGHTDGIIHISDSDELGVLEIKSINSRGFSEIKSEKPEHKRQGLVYLYCLEQRRLELQKKYPTEQDFIKSSVSRTLKYKRFYDYLQDGRKYSREEKINHQVSLCKQSDDLLYHCKTPITKVIFLYENKDTQDLKEYCVVSTQPDSVRVMSDIINEFSVLNEAVQNKIVPPREGNSKSDNMCRWCSFKTECWN